MHKKPGMFGLTKQERTVEMSIEMKTNVRGSNTKAEMEVQL